jgi:cyclic pyranopterin phosphate synthase
MIDRLGRSVTYLRVSVTDRCNFRCTYCTLPASPRGLMTVDEIVRLVGVAASLGIVKIRLTGGEPTVRPEIVEITRRTAAVPGIGQVVMTTNGSRLRGLASDLRAAGLSGLNVSLDSLDPARFRVLTHGGEVGPVLEGIEAARTAGFDRLKVNAVVVGGMNDGEVFDFADFAARVGVEARFIEYMPTRRGEARGWTVPYTVLLDRLRERFTLTPIPALADGGPAERFRIEETGAVVGFIHAMSNPFCERCNRLRITPDGRIRSCLLTGGEVDFLAAMRAGESDEHLAGLFRRAGDLKPAVYELHRLDELDMRAVGG